MCPLKLDFKGCMLQKQWNNVLIHNYHEVLLHRIANMQHLPPLQCELLSIMKGISKYQIMANYCQDKTLQNLLFQRIIETKQQLIDIIKEKADQIVINYEMPQPWQGLLKKIQDDAESFKLHKIIYYELLYKIKGQKIPKYYRPYSKQQANVQESLDSIRNQILQMESFSLNYVPDLDLKEKLIEQVLGYKCELGFLQTKVNKIIREQNKRIKTELQYSGPAEWETTLHAWSKESSPLTQAQIIDIYNGIRALDKLKMHAEYSLRTQNKVYKNIAERVKSAKEKFQPFLKRLGRESYTIKHFDTKQILQKGFKFEWEKEFDQVRHLSAEQLAQLIEQQQINNEPQFLQRIEQGIELLFQASSSLEFKSTNGIRLLRRGGEAMSGLRELKLTWRQATHHIEARKLLQKRDQFKQLIIGPYLALDDNNYEYGNKKQKISIKDSSQIIQYIRDIEQLQLEIKDIDVKQQLLENSIYLRSIIEMLPRNYVINFQKVKIQ